MRRQISVLLLLPLAAMSLAVPAFAATYNWNSNNSGNWDNTTATGWNTTPGDYPNGTDDVANFVFNITVNRTITINVADARVGSMTLTDTAATIANWITTEAATNK